MTTYIIIGIFVFLGTFFGCYLYWHKRVKEVQKLDEEIYRVSTSNDIVEFENYGIASEKSTIEMYYSIINGYYLQSYLNDEEVKDDIINSFSNGGAQKFFHT